MPVIGFPAAVEKIRKALKFPAMAEGYAMKITVPSEAGTPGRRAIGTVIQIDTSFRLHTWLFGDDIHYPAHRTRTIQRGVRASNDLYTLNRTERHEVPQGAPGFGAECRPPINKEQYPVPNPASCYLGCATDGKSLYIGPAGPGNDYPRHLIECLVKGRNTAFAEIFGGNYPDTCGGELGGLRPRTCCDNDLSYG